MRSLSLLSLVALATLPACTARDAPATESPASLSVADAVSALEAAEAVADADVEGLGVSVDRAVAVVRAVDNAGLLAGDRAAAGALEARLGALANRLRHAREAARSQAPEPTAARLPFDLKVQIAGDGDPSTVLFAAGPGDHCLGKNEGNDNFGDAIELGDFDGDGFDDLAVGTPSEQNQLALNTGMVYVYRGGVDGFEPWFALTQKSLGATETGDLFGSALAAGDFDGDGVDDLAVGAPGEDLGSVADTGYVFVFRGGPDGLTPWKGVSQNGIGANEAGDGFGETLVSGDFNGDDRDDLAVYASGESTLGAVYTGFVFVFRGDDTGLVAMYGLHHTSMAPAQDGERFGEAMAVGDFDGDSRDDLAIGARRADGDRGAVWIFLANFLPVQQSLLARAAADLPYRLAAAQRIDQTGLGANEPFDWFGRTVASGDFDGDGDDDLAVGAPGEDAFGETDTGYGFVFRNSGGEMSPWRALHTKSFADPLPHSNFAWSMVSADFNGDGRDDLAVGREKHATILNAGQLFLWRGGPGGLADWAVLDQTPLGANESSDRFSQALAAGDMNGDGRDDLAVAAPYEGLGSVSQAGAVFGLRGRTGSQPPNGVDLITQQQSGCLPTWPTSPEVDLVGVSHDRLDIRFSGDATVTHLETSSTGIPGSIRTDATKELEREFHGLSGATEYCFRARALNAESDAWSDTRTRCFTTDPSPGPDPAPDPEPEPEEHTFTVWMDAQPIFEGDIPYVGSWGPIPGTRMIRFQVVRGGLTGFAMLFLKPGRSTTECDDPDAFVQITDGATATTAQIEEIFGTPEPTGRVFFVACKTGAFAHSVPIKLTYVYDD